MLGKTMISGERVVAWRGLKKAMVLDMLRQNDLERASDNAGFTAIASLPLDIIVGCSLKLALQVLHTARPTECCLGVPFCYCHSSKIHVWAARGKPC